MDHFSAESAKGEKNNRFVSSFNSTTTDLKDLFPTPASPPPPIVETYVLRYSSKRSRFELVAPVGFTCRHKVPTVRITTYGVRYTGTAVVAGAAGSVDTTINYSPVGRLWFSSKPKASARVHLKKRKKNRKTMFVIIVFRNSN